MFAEGPSSSLILTASEKGTNMVLGNQIYTIALNFSTEKDYFIK